MTIDYKCSVYMELLDYDFQMYPTNPKPSLQNMLNAQIDLDVITRVSEAIELLLTLISDMETMLI